MMKQDEYDVIILGCGEGGKTIAWSLAKKGYKVALIERQYIGGSCPNIACLPSKNIIHSAKIASYFGRSQEFGITIDKCKINMSAVRDRKRKMVNELVDMHLDLFKQSGAELIRGQGSFIGPKTIKVELQDGTSRILNADKIVISTGSRAKIDPIPGIEEACPLTHIEALELDHVPDHLIIIGGGYVGLELAQAMRRFGSQVTIIDRNERLLHKEDLDISEGISELCQDEGITVVTSAHIKNIEGKSGQKVKINLAAGHDLQGTHLLVATGRIPNTRDIGLELAGVEITDHGHVKVNEKLETTAPNIWAVGDCAGSPNFTHIAYDDHRIVVNNVLGGHSVTTGRQVPFCMFIDPEFARIGLSESEAKLQGIPYRLAKIPMKKDLRTRTLSETRGFMKALIDVKSDNILGFTVFGIGAGEIMATVQLAMLAKLPYTLLRDAIFTHPTLTEGLIPLFSNVPSIKIPLC